ncbi:MAG: hypothetical protein V4722_12530 [Bacteroidota bacterium]
MSILSNPFVLSILIIGLIWLYIKYFHKYVEQFLQWLGAIPKSSNGKIFVTLLRVLYHNWYIVFMLLLLWILLFRQAVGDDIIDDYLSNLPLYQIWEKALSLLSLSSTLFLMSAAIWIIPFFMYSPQRQRQIESAPSSYFLGTKIMALLAMAPYGIVGGKFLAFLSETLHLNIADWVINLAFIVLFFSIQFLISRISNSSIGEIRFFKKVFGKSRYTNILAWILIWHIALILATILILKVLDTTSIMCCIVPIYMLFSSSVVFRLLYYTNDTKLSKEEVTGLVAEMLSVKNRKASKIIYTLLALLLLSGIFYYFIVPSLTATNSLYILLVVFGFIILYLDYMRYLFNNSKNPLAKIFAAVAIIVLVIMPFITPSKQFNVRLLDYAGDIDSKISLDTALNMRLRFIKSKDTSGRGNIYIVCGMGGGSRAGYITASVLKVLDSLDGTFLDRTLCYSTISGSSPGVYHYLKTRDSNNSDPRFLSHIYQQNYNSSGVFGLLFGDATEAFFGSLLSKPLSWISDSAAPNGFYDRNVRIRREYEFALQQALGGNYGNGWWDKTFGLNTRNGNNRADYFESYFQKKPGQIPIHFINTFEVNSGRRAVLSPFAVKDSNVFTNAMLPLQDSSFAKDIRKKDIMYRDATNLSELFPFLSGASKIGDSSNAQFVDGGYFENYGLATALDIFEHIQRIDTSSARRIKFILIKNSLQDAKIDKAAIQLVAPLAGAISSPFTGHANHFLKLFDNRFGSSRFHKILFNGDSYKVPLTRALTKNHIDSMNVFLHVTKLDKADSLTNFLK